MVDKNSTPPADSNSDSEALRPSYAFEHVAAKLVPFDLMTIGARGVAKPSPTSQAAVTQNTTSSGTNSMKLSPQGQQKDNQPMAGGDSRANHALFPIFQTNGLIFPYNPTISEGVNVNYDSLDVTHSNEQYFVYKNTSNVRITLSNAVWTCDTFDNAVYALAALHFFRAYSLMDFGMPQGTRTPSGKPPAPMWFSAYGNYAFHRVPVLLEKADWSFPNDVDYVGVPEFDTTEFLDRRLATRRGVSGKYTWLPMKFEVSSISLIVQHSPTYWLNFNLDDYRSGRMLQNRSSFHSAGREIARSR